MQGDSTETNIKTAVRSPMSKQESKLPAKAADHESRTCGQPLELLPGDLGPGFDLSSMVERIQNEIAEIFMVPSRLLYGHTASPETRSLTDLVDIENRIPRSSRKGIWGA